MAHLTVTVGNEEAELRIWEGRIQEHILYSGFAVTVGEAAFLWPYYDKSEPTKPCVVHVKLYKESLPVFPPQVLVEGLDLPFTVEEEDEASIRFRFPSNGSVNLLDTLGLNILTRLQEYERQLEEGVDEDNWSAVYKDD